MSDILKHRSLTPLLTQLPVSSYFDEALYQQEMEVLFKNGPSYVGHELMVPEVGNYHTVPAENNGRVLIRDEAGVRLMSNVCRHRQAVMLKGKGSIENNNIVCPLHRWTYNTKGELLGAPHFKDQPCTHLKNYPLQNWKGLLFDGQRDILGDLANMANHDQFDFTDYRLDHVEVHECNYNWKTFIEVYLEDYHVVPFHPGLGQFVSCDDLTWDFGDWYSVQTVGVHENLAKPGSSIYQIWHQAVLNRYRGQTPPFGAIWLTYYPNIMVEWYPHVLVVSTLHPNGPRHTTNIVEFYYPEEIVHFEREFIEIERAAYMETCLEDDEIGERMDAGREALYRMGQNEVGPYQSPMEDGMEHFHQFYRQQMKF